MVKKIEKKIVCRKVLLEKNCLQRCLDIKKKFAERDFSSPPPGKIMVRMQTFGGQTRCIMGDVEMVNSPFADRAFARETKGSADKGFPVPDSRTSGLHVCSRDVSIYYMGNSWHNYLPLKISLFQTANQKNSNLFKHSMSPEPFVSHAKVLWAMGSRNIFSAGI